MCTMPDESICTNTCGSVTTPCGIASAPVFHAQASFGRNCAAMTKPPVEAKPLRTPRRLTFSMKYVMSRSRGSQADSCLDALITAASTDVAGHGGVDLVGRGVGRLCQKRRRLHDLPGLAVAALRHVYRPPGAL